MPRVKGLFVPVYADSTRHPKIVRASKVLGIKPVQMLGHMVSLWAWCIEYAQQGIIAVEDDEAVADAASWDEDAGQFVKALLKVGLLDDEHDGLHVHDWPEYGGRVLKNLTKNREHQQAFRERQQGVSLTSSLRQGGDHTIHTRQDKTATPRTHAREGNANGNRDISLTLSQPSQYENELDDGVVTFQAKGIAALFAKIDKHHDFATVEACERWLRSLLREAYAECGDLPQDEIKVRFFAAIKRVKDRLAAIQDGRKKTAEPPERYVRGVFMNVMAEADAAT